MEQIRITPEEWQSGTKTLPDGSLLELRDPKAQYLVEPYEPRIRTHYLDWERIWTEDGMRAGRQGSLRVFTGGTPRWAPTDTGDEWVTSCIQFWYLGYYVAGPWEPGYGRALDERDAQLLCEMLWHKYNADDRPDGRTRRSMSVGDLLEIDGAFYLARGAGWSRVELPPREEVPSDAP